MNNSGAILILLSFWLGTRRTLTADIDDTTLKCSDTPDKLCNFVIQLDFFGEELFCSATVLYDVEENILLADFCSGHWKIKRELSGNEAIQWYKFAPRDKEEFCIKVPGDNFDQLLPFAHLAGHFRSLYKYIGNEKISGIETEIWNLVTPDGYNFTTNIRYQKSTENPTKVIAVPIKINLIKNRHDYGYFEITSFSEEKPDTKSFKAAFETTKCTGLPNTTIEWFPSGLYTKENEKNFTVPEELLKNLPDSFDWRTQGAVVERNDDCQSDISWACAAAAVVEGAYFLHNNRSKLVRLSKQSIMDCAGSWHIKTKRNTLWDYYAYEWIIKNKGIPEEDQYPGPNTNSHEKCKAENAKSSVAIAGWGKVSWMREVNQTKAALIHYGPLSISSLDIDKRIVKKFPERIYDNLKDDKGRNQYHVNMLHSALLVGYGKENNEDYWIIKPFFGSKYGQQGYIKLSTTYDSWIGHRSDYDLAHYVTF